MKTKRITYLATALALMAAGSSCEHDEIYEPLEFSVQLAPTNTYKTGDPVVFNFSGNADYITVWNGDTGHEYRYRDRTSVAFEDIISCKLSFGLAQAYGQTDTDTRYCNILVTDQFEGLNGADAEADGALVAAIDDQYTGWTELEYENLSNRVSLANVPKVPYSYDITKYAENFGFALHFHHGENQNMRSFALNNIQIEVQFNGWREEGVEINVPVHARGIHLGDNWEQVLEAVGFSQQEREIIGGPQDVFVTRETTDGQTIWRVGFSSTENTDGAGEIIFFYRDEAGERQADLRFVGGALSGFYVWPYRVAG